MASSSPFTSMSESERPGGGVFTPGGNVWFIDADDHAASMSPIHHSTLAGSTPTKRRKCRYQMEPLAV